MTVKVAQIIKWTILIGEKNRFWAKRRRKNGFFGVFRHYFKETLRKFAGLLRLSSNLRDSRLFDCKNCAKNKMDKFNWRKNYVLGQMLSKKRVFRGFRHYFRKMLRKLAVLLRLSSKLQGIRLFNCKRCENNKIDHFSFKKKIVSGPKNVGKTGFLLFSDITSGKRFPNLLYCSDSAQNYRIAAYLIVKFAQIIK